MPRISKQKQDRISEQILHYLFTISPEAKFTSDIGKEIARDEEFTKVLLTDLRTKKLVNEIKKSPKGLDYSKRQRWIISPEAYDIYKKAQNKVSSQNNNIYNQSDEL